MKRTLIAINIFLLVQFSCSSVIPIEGVKEFEENDSSTYSNDEELIFAHVLFRHGERNIKGPYPTDPNSDEKQWPGGFGQLTNNGKLQMFRLGKYIKRRYEMLLDDKYSHAQVYVQSTDVDRTLMSAQANLAGLFVPTDEEIWNEKIAWQPIPVHTIPKSSDYVLFTGKYCERYEAEHEKFMKESEEVQRIYRDYADLFSYWSHMSGLKIETIDDVYSLHDILEIEKNFNKPLPKWAEEALESNGPMEYISKVNYKLSSATPTLARLRYGFLIKEMLKHFSKKVKSSLRPDRSLWLYSAHDFTLSNVLNALGLFELHFPSYGASLHFELYRRSKKNYYIQIFYRNFEEEDPKPLNIPGCGEKCPLDEFYDLYDNIIPGNFYSECKLS